MPSQDNRPGKWRKFFRRLRTAVLVFILLLICAGLYLNRVGLPGFIKNPLLAKLHARGIDLQVSRLRWSWTRGIVADNVTFSSTNEILSPRLLLKQVQVRLNPGALAKFDFQITSLVLRRGEFRWPTDTNDPPREIAAHNIETELKFLPDDCWELEHFQAEFYGAKLSFIGSVTNASALREIFKPKEKKQPGVFQSRLDEFAKTMEQVKFASPADLKILVQGDARDPQSFRGIITLHAPDADAPWGKVSEGLFTARIFQDKTNAGTRADLKLEAGSAEASWAVTNRARARKLELGAQIFSPANDTNMVSGNLVLSAAEVETGWGTGTNAQLIANWIQSRTNTIPISGHADLRLAGAKTKWGNAAQANLLADLAESRTNVTGSARQDWVWWNTIAPFDLRWQCELAGIQSTNLEVEQFTCSGNWSAPELKLEKIHSQLYGGQLDAAANLNVATRAARFELTSDFDAQKISPLLTEGGRRWMQKFSWQQPPKLHGNGSVILPAWTNKHPDWRAEVQPTLVLNAEVSTDSGGAYKGVPISTARSRISYSNMVWVLPDLVVTRPEGSAELWHRADDRTKDYYWKIHATIDPKALRSLLETNAQRGLDLFDLTTPPRVDGEVWGRFHDYDRTGFRGRVALSNFTFRGESVSDFQTAVEMTNKFIQFLEPKLSRGGEKMSATGIGLDLDTKRLFFTNGFSTADPMAVARGIGKKTAQHFAPHQFLKPPTVHARGMIEIRPAGIPDLGDMEFDVDGGPYRWNKFTSTRVVGKIFWRGEMLVLTNMHLDFYDGKLEGNAAFDLSPGLGTDFQFELRARGVDFHSLMTDISSQTNKLEGRLNARLAVANANSRDLGSWSGHGRVHLRDGLIWDIPVFGVFSPVLNAVWPGLGNSRAGEAEGSFVITNGLVMTDDLEIHASAMRMNYRGSVDFQSRPGEINARVEAALLRNVWGVGPVFSTIFWPITKMFEYEITGTLGHPNTEPVYVLPKLLMMPFYPFKLMKGLFPDSSGGTNAPPGYYKFADPNEPELKKQNEK